MLFVVWGTTTAVGPFIGAAFGIVVVTLLSPMLGEIPDREVAQALLGAGVLLAVLVGGTVGFTAGIGAGLISGGVAALLFDKLPTLVTAMIAAAAGAGVIVLLGAAPTAGDDVANAGIAAALFLLPAAVIFATEFLIVAVAARRARRAARVADFSPFAG